MAVAVLFVSMLFSSNIIALIVGIFTGIGYYFLINRIFGSLEFKLLFGFVKRRI
jgi:hypothetical protein